MIEKVELNGYHSAWLAPENPGVARRGGERPHHLGSRSRRDRRGTREAGLHRVASSASAADEGRLGHRPAAVHPSQDPGDVLMQSATPIVVELAALSAPGRKRFPLEQSIDFGSACCTRPARPRAGTRCATSPGTTFDAATPRRRGARGGAQGLEPPRVDRVHRASPRRPALLIRFCLEPGREADPKYFLTVRNTEEAWHVESFHRVAELCGGYLDRPANRVGAGDQPDALPRRARRGPLAGRVRRRALRGRGRPRARALSTPISPTPAMPVISRCSTTSSPTSGATPSSAGCISARARRSWMPRRRRPLIARSATGSRTWRRAQGYHVPTLAAFDTRDEAAGRRSPRPPDWARSRPRPRRRRSSRTSDARGSGSPNSASSRRRRRTTCAALGAV